MEPKSVLTASVEQQYLKVALYIFVEGSFQH